MTRGYPHFRKAPFIVSWFWRTMNNQPNHPASCWDLDSWNLSSKKSRHSSPGSSWPLQGTFTSMAPHMRVSLRGCNETWATRETHYNKLYSPFTLLRLSKALELCDLCQDLRPSFLLWISMICCNVTITYCRYQDHWSYFSSIICSYQQHIESWILVLRGTSVSQVIFGIIEWWFQQTSPENSPILCLVGVE